MKTLILKPVVEACEGGWQAKAGLYDNNLMIACEVFKAYDDKQEAWDNAQESSKQFVANHNKTCQHDKMVVGSY